MNRQHAEIHYQADTGLVAGTVQVGPAAPNHVEIIAQGYAGATIATMTKAQFAHLVASVLVPADLAAQFQGRG